MMLLVTLAALITGISPAALGKRADAQNVLPPELTTGVSDITFVAFDTETTGLSPYRDRVVEIGVAKYRAGRIVEEKSWLINPGRNIPYWAERVHGITTAMVKSQPTFREVYPEFRDFVDGCVLLAHNARFDIGFIREEIERNKGKLPQNIVIDSLSLFRNWYPDSKSHSLEALVEHTKVKDNKKFHRAQADSRYLALILEEGLQKHPETESLADLCKAAGGGLDFEGRVTTP